MTTNTFIDITPEAITDYIIENLNYENPGAKDDYSLYADASGKIHHLSNGAYLQHDVEVTHLIDITFINDLDYCDDDIFDMVYFILHA